MDDTWRNTTLEALHYILFYILKEKKRRFPACALYLDKAEIQPQFYLTFHCMNDGNATDPKPNLPVTGLQPLSK